MGWIVRTYAFFKGLDIGTAFCFPDKTEMKFVKFAEADPNTPALLAKPNTYCMYDGTYLSVPGNAKVTILHQPKDYLKIVNKDDE